MLKPNTLIFSSWLPVTIPHSLFNTHWQHVIFPESYKHRHYEIQIPIFCLFSQCTTFSHILPTSNFVNWVKTLNKSAVLEIVKNNFVYVTVSMARNGSLTKMIFILFWSHNKLVVLNYYYYYYWIAFLPKYLSCWTFNCQFA